MIKRRKIPAWKLRCRVKTAAEIKKIQKACSETSKIFGKCIQLIPKLKSEKEIKSCLAKEAKKKGYKIAYDVIVASGKNAANPHYEKCRSKLKRGFLVIDFGVKYKGYCSDMTRTVFLGKPAKKQRKLYNKVLNVQKKAIEMFRKNKTMGQADKYARKRLGKEFIHCLGHGVGKKIHEPPLMRPDNKNKISNNACFTVEPGVYRKARYGIRIEDTLVKINNKIKILTPLSKKLVIIDNKIYK